MVAELVPKPSVSSNGAGRSQVIDFNCAYDHEGFEGLDVMVMAAKHAAGYAPLAPPRTLYNLAALGTLPPISWLIPGEIPVGLTMLFGASGGGKSFVALDYALRIAQQQGRIVIYVAAEGAGGYFDRATAWCKHHRYSGDGLRFDLQPLELRNAEAVQAFVEMIKLLNPGLVVIDTLARCAIGLDENSARYGHSDRSMRHYYSRDRRGGDAGASHGQKRCWRARQQCALCRLR